MAGKEGRTEGGTREECEAEGPQSSYAPDVKSAKSEVRRKLGEPGLQSCKLNITRKKNKGKEKRSETA